MEANLQALRYLLLSALVLGCGSCGDEELPPNQQPRGQVEANWQQQGQIDQKLAEVQALVEKKYAGREKEIQRQKLQELLDYRNAGIITESKFREEINKLLEEEEDEGEKETEKRLLKRLNKDCEKNGGPPDMGDNLLCNTLVWYYELKKTKPQEAREIILPLAQKRDIEDEDLQVCITKFLAALGKEQATIEAYKTKMNTPGNLVARNNTFRKKTDAYKWQNAPAKAEVDKHTQKIDKDINEIDKLFQKYQEHALKVLVLTDRRVELEEGLEDAKQERDEAVLPEEITRIDELIEDYEFLLQEKNLILAMKRDINAMVKAAPQQTRYPGLARVFAIFRKSSPISAKDEELRETFLQYINKARQNTEERFEYKEYEQVIEDYEEIKNQARAVAFSTDLTGNEKEAKLQEYKTQLDPIKDQLKKKKQEIKDALGYKSFFSKVGDFIKEPF